MPLRQRKEVQKMLRRHLLALLLCPILHAAIWPEQIGTLKRGETHKVSAPDQGLWAEYGFDTAEQSQFSGTDRRLTATAWRLKDPTGAMAALQSLSLRNQANLVQVDNYVLQCQGGSLSEAELNTGLGEAALIGQATIDGHPVELSVMDFSFMGGSMGSAVGEKFSRACDSAIERSVPLVSVTTTGTAESSSIHAMRSIGYEGSSGT